MFACTLLLALDRLAFACVMYWFWCPFLFWIGKCLEPVWLLMSYMLCIIIIIMKMLTWTGTHYSPTTRMHSIQGPSGTDQCQFLRKHGWPHTPSTAFWHLPPNSARFSYATEGALFISVQLSSNAISTLRKVRVLIRLELVEATQTPSTGSWHPFFNHCCI